MNKKKLENLFDDLFPLNRSILGEDYRNSLDLLKKYVPFKYYDFKSGTKVFDWTVPKEWKINEAYISKLNGEKIIDFTNSNLHVLNYSSPIDKIISLEELKNKIFTLKSKPKAIPYVTSYYKKNWGFCMSYNDFKNLNDAEYKVKIDSKFTDGNLRIGEAVLKGSSKKEILITSYLCHPSMANNELSGPLCLVYLYNKLKNKKNRQFTYRFIINPETIGSLCYLSEKYDILKKNVIAGVVLTCLGGDRKKLSFKLSKSSDSIFDKYFLNIGQSDKVDIRKFTAFGGSDERQFNSPRINLPISQISKTIYGMHDEYHTSLDNKEFLNFNEFYKSCNDVLNHFIGIDNANYYYNSKGFGELFLSKRNLYPTINSEETRVNKSNDDIEDNNRMQKTIMYLLNYSDGKHSLTDIANLLEEQIDYVEKILNILYKNKLLQKL
ncbi:MAG: DUF4910 domain-containing protein [Flavobacteriaceae bacterium]|nr:DUF4910 domain-containing protein [Flavobacteriaceae bacterium]